MPTPRHLFALSALLLVFTAQAADPQVPAPPSKHYKAHLEGVTEANRAQVREALGKIEKVESAVVFKDGQVKFTMKDDQTRLWSKNVTEALANIKNVTVKKFFPVKE